ncbi:MAG: 3-methyl-2-oxobutanoate hydroxymethyltransferase [Deltaproteobacteria bacterium]|nr:3-methyl-2-oxobutanoate hydroxymethyltransferase [Deltaproteobacteria bacterium]
MLSEKVTIPKLRKMKVERRKIAMLTAYDATFAQILDQAGVDIILVGDSLGRVVQGHDNTLPVTFEQSLYHTQSVGRGVKRAMIVTDMPFMSYQVSGEQALLNCGRVLKETLAIAVKLEGGMEIVPTVKALTGVGIPVMGHIGLQPQSIHALGGYKMKGKNLPEARELLETARVLEEAGCFSLVLECVTAETAQEITESLQIPTIGIAAGPHCDGQVLVIHDMLGLIPDLRLRHVKVYADLHPIITNAVQEYIHEVQTGSFPSEAQTTHREPPLKIARSKR